MVLVLIVVSPDTLKVVRPVTVLAAAAPNTALPVIPKLLLFPTTVPLVVMMLPVKAVALPKAMLSL